MYKLRVDKSDRKLISPKQVNRSARLAINELTSEAHKELGREVPKTHGTSITGYRRVRSKKKLAKARARGMRGIVWQGTMRVQAVYAGKPRKVTGGVKAGKHYFPGAFIAKMKSGHVGIFQRSVEDPTKIVEERIELSQAKFMVRRKSKEKLRKLPATFRKHYMKQVKK